MAQAEEQRQLQGKQTRLPCSLPPPLRVQVDDAAQLKTGHECQAERGATLLGATLLGAPFFPTLIVLHNLRHLHSDVTSMLVQGDCTSAGALEPRMLLS